MIVNQAKSEVINNNFLADLLETLPIGIVILNNAGVITTLNPAAKIVSPNLSLGKKWHSFIADNVVASTNSDALILDNGKKIHLLTKPLKSQKGQLVVLYDVTDNIAMQQKALHDERLKHLGSMLAKISHQIKTPLSTALLYAGNLQKENLANEKRQSITVRLIDSLINLDGLVNNMLKFAKQGDNVISKITAKDLMDKILDELYLIFPNEVKNIKQEVNPSDLMLVVNEKTIITAIVNLVKNSLDTKAENLQITVYLLQEKNKVKIGVKDNGPGIDANDIDKIFTPLYTTKSDGNGLGLSVVDMVAKAHHGKAYCNILQAVGADIYLLLPLI